MVKLLINDNSKKSLLEETSFGGFPVKGIDQIIEWPKCKTCKADMQYQGKIRTDLGIELIFMCNNAPGMCAQWDPESGGNKVIIIDDKNLEFFKPSDSKLSLIEIEYGVSIVETEDIDYDSARDNWKGDKGDVLGKLYGEPNWIQGEETPVCDCCHKPMRFVAQLEEGPYYSTAMNFGAGGIAYLFDCKQGKTAKFLWQC